MSTITDQLENMEVTVPPALVAAHDEACATAPHAIAEAVEKALHVLDDFLTVNAVAPAGPARVIYREWTPALVHFTAARPILAVPSHVVDTADVAIRALPESRALRFVHRGPYRDVKATYDRIDAWLRERGGIRTSADWARYTPMWEEYLNDPASTPEADLVTRIYLTLS